jgi:hypothetical protein
MNIEVRTWIGVPVRKGFYLLLSALILVDLTTSGYGLVRYLFSAPQLTEVPMLDSFSPSSTAVAALKKEAKVLLLDYTEARDSAGPSGNTSSTKGSVDKASSVRRIEKLQAMIRDVDLEITQELLLVYHENKRDNELVSTFLGLLQEFPESPEVLEWVRITLTSSQRCGRTREVQAVLEHTVRYFPTLKTQPQLIALMREWEKEK